MRVMLDTDELLERLRAGLGCAYLSDVPTLAAYPEGRAALGRCAAGIPLEEYSGGAWLQAAGYLFPGRTFPDGESARRFLLQAPAHQA